MKNNRFTILTVLIISLNSYRCTAQEQNSNFTITRSNVDISKIKEYKFPKPTGYVNDFEDLLNEEQEKELAKFLTDYEQKTTNEIAVITMNSIEPYSDFNQYAIDLSNNWGIGKKEKDNGLTIIVSKSMKKIRVTTGIGTERILTDEFCKKVIDQFMVPKFKEGDYYNGIRQGLTVFIKQWE